MRKLYKKVEGGYQLVALYDGQLPRHSPQRFRVSVAPAAWTKRDPEQDDKPLDLDAISFEARIVELRYSSDYVRHIYEVMSDISKIKSDMFDHVSSQRIEYE